MNIKFKGNQSITLLRQLVYTDFKLRYQGSILGFLWSLLKPMMIFGVLYFVFTYIIPTGKDVPHFPAYLLLGIVVWTFFAEATLMGLGSVVGRGDLIKKVKIQKIYIVVASVISASINFGLNLIVVLLFMLLNNVDVSYHLLWILPLLVIELLVLVVGVALILASLYVKFRDFAPIWEVVLQVMFYATPIIYSLSFAYSANIKIAQIISLSPMTQIIQDMRYVLITPKTLTTHQILPDIYSFVVPVIAVFVFFVFGVFFFKKRSKNFVEDL